MIVAVPGGELDEANHPLLAGDGVLCSPRWISISCTQSMLTNGTIFKNERIVSYKYHQWFKKSLIRWIMGLRFCSLILRTTICG